VGLAGCSNIISNTDTNADGIPHFVSSTLVNASYIGGSSRSTSARYIDGQENVYVPGQNGVTATFYNFGFWEGDEIELPQENIDSMWHNNDYASSIMYATKKWVAEYSLYYLKNGTAYCECRYKLRRDAPLNGIWYCYSEIIYVGSVDISTLLSASPPPPIDPATISFSTGIIADALKGGQKAASGSEGDFIVKVRETDELLKIAARIKDSMFVSVDPFQYIENGYMLINVVPKFSEYRILDPSITQCDGSYYSVMVPFRLDN
jgi:hypothetical protein